MNAKIPLKKFAEQLGTELHIPAAEAEQFVKTVFENISEELKAGGNVSIKDLGSFKLSSDSEDPVVFTPAQSFASDLNEPFAMFTPVELADEVTEADLNEIATPELPGSEKVEPEENAQPAISPEPQPQPIMEQPVEMQQTETEPVEAEPLASGQEQLPEPQQVVTPVVVAEQPEQEPEPQPEPQHEPAQPASAIREWEYEEEEYVTAPEEPETKSRFGAGFVAGLIVGLAIGALALCMYVLYFVNSSADEAPTVEEELVETAPMPTYQ
ncbi:MAG: hypothetical protein HFJ94_08005 [Muribaculaceae bacterium]|nr:hypothetical protein [Muribaculaceae bacterium]